MSTQITSPVDTPQKPILSESSALLGSILFTEDDIAEQRNTFAPVDGRILPRLGKGASFRTGKCKCGKRCWPYASCARCRELGSVHRVLKTMEEEGDVERVTDGRGRKGGATWRTTEQAKAKAAAAKAARTFRRTEPKIGRNDACPCGSGRKYKTCCLRLPNIAISESHKNA